MNRFEKTASAISDAKETALYFDYVIPLNYGLEIAKACMFAYDTQKRPGETIREFFGRYYIARIIPENFLDSVLPPQLVNDSKFRERLLDVNEASGEAVSQSVGPLHPEEIPQSCREYGKVCFALLRDFELTDTPMDVPDIFVSDDGAAEESETAITLRSLNLIDVRPASWEQILEFRRDQDARHKLLRLRLFALENYSGKSKSFIEDDISLRIFDYEEAVRKWGFETKYAAFTMLLKSKTLGGALTGSLVSTLLGAPLAALGSALVGVLEIGHVALEVRKQRFLLRDLMRENPVCYISEARSKLSRQE